MPVAINKYPTHCVDCDKKMPAGHGQVNRVGGRWVVAHARTGRSLSQQQFSRDNSDDGYDALKDGVRERWG